MIDAEFSCDNCGALVVGAANFCVHCGGKVGDLPVSDKAPSDFGDRFGQPRARAIRSAPFIVAVLAFFLRG